MSRIRALIQRNPFRTIVISLGLLLALGVYGVRVLVDERTTERRRNDVVSCVNVQRLVTAVDHILDFAVGDKPQPGESERVAKFRRQSDRELAAARQDCSSLPRP